MSAAAKSKVAARKRSLEAMSQEELIAELEKSDVLVAKLQSENKRLKTTPSSASASTTLSPEQIAAKVQKLKDIAYRGIKSQMKWKPSLKHGLGRWSWSGMCDEATFRGFMNKKADQEIKITGSYGL